jgi:hypothetical protein
MQIDYVDDNEHEPWSGQAIEFYRRSRIAARKRLHKLLYLGGGLLVAACIGTVIMANLPKLIALFK